MHTPQLSDTKKLTIVGLMAALTIILAYTPLGMIPFGAVSATITHIPTIITAILFGPFLGACVGFVLGVVTVVRAATSPLSPIDPLFINPVISVLPRVLISFGAFYSYRLLRSLNKYAGVVFGVAVGSLTNSVLVLGLLYIIYAKVVVEKLQTAMPGITAEKFVYLVMSTSGVLEMLTCVVICSPIIIALKRIKL